jgi:hypothetical protein
VVVVVAERGGIVCDQICTHTHTQGRAGGECLADQVASEVREGRSRGSVGGAHGECASLLHAQAQCAPQTLYRTHPQSDPQPFTQRGQKSTSLPHTTIYMKRSVHSFLGRLLHTGGRERERGGCGVPMIAGEVWGGTPPPIEEYVPFLRRDQ